jgi:hypothetical protein
VAILLLVVIAASSFQRPPDEPARIVMLGHAPSQVHAGEVFALKLLIDAMDGAVRREPEPLRDVNLRLPRAFFGRFALLGLQPLPDRVTELGNGRYFFYQEIARGTTLVMTLRALRPGRHDVNMRIRERGLSTVGYHTRIMVLAPLKQGAVKIVKEISCPFPPKTEPWPLLCAAVWPVPNSISPNSSFRVREVSWK